jgi:hypothetical protein
MAHPFKVGTRVCVVESLGWGTMTYGDAVITKCTPTGRLSIKYAHGYEPKDVYQATESWIDGKSSWEARLPKSHHSYYKKSLQVWDASIEARIAAKEARNQRVNDIQKIKERVSKLHPTEDALIHNLMKVLFEDEAVSQGEMERAHYGNVK